MQEKVPRNRGTFCLSMHRTSVRHALAELRKRPDRRGNEQDVRCDPCDRAGKADAREFQRPHEHECREHTRRKLRQTGTHRQETVAHALKRIAHHEQDGERRVEQTGDAQIAHGIFQNDRKCRIIALEEQIHEVLPQEIAERIRRRGVDQRCQQTAAQTLPDAVELAGAEVLSAVGCHGDAHGFHRAHDHGLDLERRGDAADDVRAEAVDRRLHDERADRRDRELERHRQADAAEPRDQIGTGLEFVRFKREHREFPVHVVQAAERRDALCDNGRKTGTHDAEVEHEDHRKVQPDVQHRGQRQKEQGRGAVAHRTEESGEEVVEDGCRQSREDRVEVRRRIVDDVRRRFQQP